MHPTNHKAIGAAGACTGGRLGGDTEDGVRKWMPRLAERLKGANPTPVTIGSQESQDPDAPATRIELLINDFTPLEAPT